MTGFEVAVRVTDRARPDRWRDCVFVLPHNYRREDEWRLITRLVALIEEVRDKG